MGNTAYAPPASTNDDNPGNEGNGIMPSAPTGYSADDIHIAPMAFGDNQIDIAPSAPIHNIEPGYDQSEEIDQQISIIPGNETAISIEKYIEWPSHLQWKCPNCTTMNEAKFKSCGFCETKRPSYQPPAPEPSAPPIKVVKSEVDQKEVDEITNILWDSPNAEIPQESEGVIKGVADHNNKNEKVDYAPQAFAGEIAKEQEPKKWDDGHGKKDDVNKNDDDVIFGGYYPDDEAWRLFNSCCGFLSIIMMICACAIGELTVDSPNLDSISLVCGWREYNTLDGDSISTYADLCIDEYDEWCDVDVNASYVLILSILALTSAVAACCLNHFGCCDDCCCCHKEWIGMISFLIPTACASAALIVWALMDSDYQCAMSLSGYNGRIETTKGKTIDFLISSAVFSFAAVMMPCMCHWLD